MQGIKDEKLLVSFLSRVVAKELSLKEMVTEFKIRLVTLLSFYYIASVRT